jgi:hypothetical protein
LNRRLFLQAAAALPLASSTAGGLALPAHAESAAFDRSIVRQSARDAASKPFKAPDSKLPDSLKNLDYDHYRAIRFFPEHALWRGEKLPFQVQFFHRGFYYAPRKLLYFRTIPGGPGCTPARCGRMRRHPSIKAARIADASGRLKARPPWSLGLSRKSPTVAPSGRVRMNAAQNSVTRDMLVQK